MIEKYNKKSSLLANTSQSDNQKPSLTNEN